MDFDNFVSRNKATVLRFARALASVVLAAVVAWLAGPDVAGIVGTEAAVVIGAVVVPFLQGLDKYLRTPNGELVVAPGTPYKDGSVPPNDSTSK